MATKSPPSIVYSDLEKLHRVIGYYDGQKLKPLEIHEKFISENLDRTIRAPEQYIKSFQFDLFMTHAALSNEKVFTTDKPETSLLYLLFSEGIKSLIILRDVSAIEFKEWCILVRETLVALDAGQSKDLASVLWKTPFRNLRARIYNSLMDLQETQDPQDDSEKAKKTKPSQWHKRDMEWDSPSGETVIRSEEASEGVSADILTSFRKATISRRRNPTNQTVLRVQNSELDLLSSEMSSYDTNQVDFNLLSWTQNLIQGTETYEPETEKIVEALNLEIAEAVIKRFHPSLILVLLEMIKNLPTNKFSTLKSKLNQKIVETLANKDIIHKLIDALRDPDRAIIAQKLFPQIPEDQIGSVFDYYIYKSNREGLLITLKALLDRPKSAVDLLLSWNEIRLSKIIPLVDELDWKDKDEFLIKALKNKHPEVVNLASKFILKLNIKADHALDIYRKLSEASKEVWIRQFFERPPQTNWKDFIQKIFSNHFWKNDSFELRNLWIQSAFNYFDIYAFDFFEIFVKPRRWIFWAKYPELREQILSIALGLKNDRLKPKVYEWAEREKGLLFQNEELKNRLSLRARLKQ